jgi:hypothetical protein
MKKSDNLKIISRLLPSGRRTGRRFTPRNDLVVKIIHKLVANKSAGKNKYSFDHEQNY